MLLIAGGVSDPSLAALASAAQARHARWLDARIPLTDSPSFHWDLSLQTSASAWPACQGQVVTAAFLRHDVFAALADPRPVVAERAQGWFAAMHGWLLAHPEVRVFNADMHPVAGNKPAALLQARAHGLRIPHTWVCNDMARLKSRLGQAPAIAKPVAGGGHCQTLDEAVSQVSHAQAAMPALIQPRLIAPEYRVFVIGEQVLTFEVSSPSLDYRVNQDAVVCPAPNPPEAAGLQALMKTLRMDFGAADFKTDPDTGALVFLELNTSPMFAHFDEVSDGAVCGAMLDHLLGVQ